MYVVRPVCEPQRAYVRPRERESRIAAHPECTVRLNGAIEHPKRGVRHYDFDHRNLGPGLLVADRVHPVRSVERQEPRLVDIHARICDIAPQSTLLGERGAESPARQASAAQELEGALGGAY